MVRLPGHFMGAERDNLSARGKNVHTLDLARPNGAALNTVQEHAFGNLTDPLQWPAPEQLSGKPFETVGVHWIECIDVDGHKPAPKRQSDAVARVLPRPLLDLSLGWHLCAVPGPPGYEAGLVGRHDRKDRVTPGQKMKAPLLEKPVTCMRIRFGPHRPSPAQGSRADPLGSNELSPALRGGAGYRVIYTWRSARERSIKPAVRFDGLAALQAGRVWLHVSHLPP